MSDETLRKPTPLARKLGLSLGVLVVLCGLLEIAVRSRAWMQHGVFGRLQEFVEDPTSGLWLPIAGRVTGPIRINSKHFRGPEVELPKPPGRIRVAFLGGSTTYCAEVSAEGLTWPALVVEGLAERFPEREFDWVNGGVPGFGVDHSLLNLTHRVAPLEPDVIVIYHATNDITRDTREQAKEQGVYTEHADRDTWMARTSLAWHLVEKNLLARSRSDAAVGTQARLELDVSDGLTDRFESELTRLVEESAQVTGEDTGVVLLPTFCNQARRDQTRERQIEACNTSFYYMPYITLEGVLDAFDAYNAVIRRVGGATGAILVDGEDAIPGDRVHFADSVHFTDAGSRLMADRVLQALVESPGLQALVARPVKQGG